MIARALLSVYDKAGLEELAQLEPAVRRSRYDVRVTSPDPCVRLVPRRKTR